MITRSGDEESMAAHEEAASGEVLWLSAVRDAVGERMFVRELSAHGLLRETDPATARCRGVVASLEPTAGDPQTLAVFPEDDPEPTWVDRRTMRMVHVPRTSLARESDVVQVADLADRAQLVLGEPLLLRYEIHGERAAIVGARRFKPQIRFTNENYRETAALVATHSTLAPLSIDALSRALRIEGESGQEPRVRRLFGRAYRVVDEHHTPWADGRRETVRALGRLSRLGRDVAMSLADARAFEASAASAMARFGLVRLADLDKRDLVESLETRMRLVTDAMSLLERSRLASLGLLPALEAACGIVPRELFDAVATPEPVAERVRIDRRLANFAERTRVEAGGSARVAEGELQLPPESSSTLIQEWRQLLAELTHIRILGMDVRPQAMGAGDEDLKQAVVEAYSMLKADPRQAREHAKSALLKLSYRGPLGAVGVAPAGALLLLFERLALAKGTLAEALAGALLRLRAAAVEAGQRLMVEGILERAEDALYMPLAEIVEALEGELGAYAARVRLRREDDRRWRNFAAPRWLAARGP
jgi:hypothetical protein